jgi:2-polyprenyl-3-methyl-5-hydroxy-6-metoxy-1,4-benzoquinol methylase
LLPIVVCGKLNQFSFSLRRWAAMTSLVPLDRRRIAERYHPSQYHYWYSFSKLMLDPLYDDVRALLSGNRPPLLDVGCGIGLMLHCLRASGIGSPYLGVDIDAAKVEIARKTLRAGETAHVQFDVRDLTRDFPEHRGSVVLLDVLQYLEPTAQTALLRNAARCISPDGKLIIRGGLDDGSWRAAFTRLNDRFGHAVRWMRSSFKAQPKPAELRGLLQQQGLDVEFRQPAAHLPFNNWLIIARPSDARA